MISSATNSPFVQKEIRQVVNFCLRLCIFSSQSNMHYYQRPPRRKALLSPVRKPVRTILSITVSDAKHNPSSLFSDSLPSASFFTSDRSTFGTGWSEFSFWQSGPSLKPRNRLGSCIWSYLNSNIFLNIRKRDLSVSVGRVR